nr:DUF222 domain-containing protein [Arthrobacter sp. B3I9]
MPSPRGPCPPPADSAPRSWSPSAIATSWPGAAPDGADAGAGRTEGTGTLLFTGPVTASTARKIACDADILPVLLGSEGRILDIGRTTRIFPPHIRKALTARDQGCTIPAPGARPTTSPTGPAAGPPARTTGQLVIVPPNLVVWGQRESKH